LKGHLERFNRVVVARNRGNAGLGATRNAAVALIETPYFLPLDPDNELLPNCLSRCLAAIETSNAAFVYFGIDEFGGRTGRKPFFDYQASLFTLGNYVDAMALVRRSAWAAVGGYYDGRLGWEDYDFWCQCAERGLFGTGLPESLARYRVHTESMLHTTTDREDTRVRLIAEMHRRHPWLTIESATSDPGQREE
jgi:GT2 family glycosyltransferase